MTKTPSLWYENQLPPEDHSLAYCAECEEEMYDYEMVHLECADGITRSVCLVCSDNPDD